MEIIHVVLTTEFLPPTTVKWLRRKNDAKEDITQEHDQAHLINTQTPLQLVLDYDKAKVTCRDVKAIKACFFIVRI